MAIDWKALFVGVGIAFSPVLIAAMLSALIGDLPVGPPVGGSILGGSRALVVVAAGVFLGAVTAGYLHSPRIVGGAEYGVGVVAIGYLFPTAIVVVLVVGIGGIGWVVETGVAGLATYGFVVVLLLVVPVVGTLVLGSLGGALGSLLRRRRTS